MRKSINISVYISILVLISQNLFSQVGFVQEGMASYYANEFEGRTTASGERFSHKKATCAHMSIPFGALVKITNLENNTNAIVRVNDRGPFVPDRIVDVSQSVAQRLGIIGKGVVKVSIEVVDNSGYSIKKEETILKDSNAIPKEKSTEQKADGIENQSSVKIIKLVDTKNLPISELFAVKVNSIEQRGFTVQIGSYKELVNVLRIATDIQSATSKETMIQVVNINGEKVYRLMVGKFSSRKDAENLKEKIAKIYKDCFIVELKDQ